jgi:hypothetical protein
MPLAVQKQGQLNQTDFFDNVGGLNLADSVFRVDEGQATGGLNYDYILTGGIRKRLGPQKINSTPNSALLTTGIGIYNASSSTTKAVLRATSSYLQLFATDTGVFTNLTQDTAAAGFTPFSLTTQPVTFTQFNNGTSNINWAVGGGATFPVGAYSTANYTINGSAAPTGAFTATQSSSGTGSWGTGNHGVFYYAFVWVKRSTGALSNAAQDCTATTTADNDTVNLTLTAPSDTTLYSQVYIYRSAVGGVSGFTTGSLIAQLPSSTTTFIDKGPIGNPDVLSAQNIPRAGNVLLDNSQLPSGTYNTCTLFKRRLVTAQNSTLYFSDINKSESWPLTNYITVPSAGPILGLAVISFTAPQASSVDELLVIFKERELWVVTGTSYSDWALKFIDEVGCPQQNLIVIANGFLAWVDYRGIYLWDGNSKPIYSSRLLEPLFARDGDLDKSKFYLGDAEFFRRENQIIWYLSSKTYGTQQFAIKLDLRLTLPRIEQQLTGRNIDAVFTLDNYAFGIYGAKSYISSSTQAEALILGDSAGNMYFASSGYSDAGSAYPFSYATKALNMGNPDSKKLFHSVIVWVNDIGTWNLGLNYWADFRTGIGNQSSVVQPISTENQNSVGVWDVGYYDLAFFDGYTSNIVPIIFNLNATQNNSNQGTAIQLQFTNSTASNPITIHGFSVIWSALGGVST